MADIAITITIPDAKIAKVQEGFFYIHEQPAGMTKMNAIREYLRQCVVNQVHRGLSKKLHDLASSGVDDGVAV